jgi:hypothetical protein
MSDLQIRVPAGLAERMLDEVHRNRPEREGVVFVLASHARTASRTLILVQDVIVPPDSAFLPSNGHGARWKGAYTIELLNQALERGLGLFIIHAHAGMRDVGLAGDDRRSAEELLPKFQLVAPARPHGSIVLGEGVATGMVLLPDEERPVESFSFRLLGDKMTTLPLPSGGPEEQRLFERQPLAANPLVARRLAQATVAVVGLSGGGSQVVPFLAAMGVGEIIGIDNQTIDASNPYATPVIGWREVEHGLLKVTAMREVVRRTNRSVRFVPVVARVPEAECLEALKCADIIVGCVNNLHARADLMEVAWRYCVPYVDIGLLIKTTPPQDEDPPPIVAIPGNVFTAIPGGPCMWCTEFLTDEKLEAETSGRGRSYLTDVEERDAYVAVFNGVLASQAAAEVLQLLIGYAPPGLGAMYKRYEGIGGSMVEWVVRKRPGCGHCRKLAAGDPLWTPEGIPVGPQPDRDPHLSPCA